MNGSINSKENDNMLTVITPQQSQALVDVIQWVAQNSTTNDTIRKKLDILRPAAHTTNIEDLARRLIRIETRMCAIADAMGVDAGQSPTKEPQ